MKNQKIIITLGVIASLALLAGCDKSNETKANDAAKSISEKANAAGAEVGKAVEGVKPAVEKAVTDAKATADAAASAASAKVTSIIDQAKALVGQSKYSEATSALSQLAGLKLTPEQEKLVASLKEQIQKAMASAPAKAAGNLLKQ